MDFVFSSIHTFSIMSYDRRVAGGAEPGAREGGGLPLQPGRFISTYKNGSKSPLLSWRTDLMQVVRTVALKPAPGQADASARKN